MKPPRGGKGREKSGSLSPSVFQVTNHFQFSVCVKMPLQRRDRFNKKKYFTKKKLQLSLGTEPYTIFLSLFLDYLPITDHTL